MIIKRVLNNKQNIVLSIIKEEVEDFSNDIAFNERFKCIYNAIKTRFEQSYKLYKDNGIDDDWVDIKQLLYKFEGFLEDGDFSYSRNEFDEFMNDFTNDLNYSNEHTYKKGEVVRKLPNENIEVYKATGDKTLFRGVSLDDWKRIQNQGYIDSDMRGAIVDTEGINLGQNPDTASYYLPNNKEGVILAINPEGLDLYMLKDEYIRIFEPIPINNIVKVSDVIRKNKMGLPLNPNKNQKLETLKQQAEKLNIPINC